MALQLFKRHGAGAPLMVSVSFDLERDGHEDDRLRSEVAHDAIDALFGAHGAVANCATLHFGVKRVALDLYVPDSVTDIDAFRIEAETLFRGALIKARDARHRARPIKTESASV